MSKEAKTVWERLDAERRAAQAKEHFLVLDDWWAEGKKWNGGNNHIPKGRKGDGKGNEGEDAGDDEPEMTSRRCGGRGRRKRGRMMTRRKGALCWDC